MTNQKKHFIYQWNQSAKMVIKDPEENIMHKPSSQDFHMRRSMRGMEEHETYPVGYVARRNTSGWTRSILSPLSHNTRARDVCFIWISWEWSNVEGLSYQNLKDSNILSKTNYVHSWRKRKWTYEVLLRAMCLRPLLRTGSPLQRGLPSNEGIAVCREKAIPFSRLF